MEDSHWVHNGIEVKEVPSGMFGFIYRITDTITGKRYIGRKYFATTRRVKVKNKTRRKVVTKESNWRSYTGSSIILNEMIEEHGKDRFVFEILGYGKTQGQVNFLEEVTQIKADVLVDDTYINGSVGSRRYLNVKIDEHLIKTIKSLVL